MCESKAMRLCSRAFILTCSILSSQREETEEPEWEPRVCLERAMKVIISGIQKCMCCRFWCIQSRRQPDICWITGTAPWIRQEAEPESWDMRRAPCIHGEPLTERKLLPIIHWELLSIILMEIFPMPCPCIYR